MVKNTIISKTIETSGSQYTKKYITDTESGVHNHLNVNFDGISFRFNFTSDIITGPSGRSVKHDLK
jgi:hypothetical protein